MPEWEAMFGISASVPGLILRGTVTFLLLLALMRVAGQREAGGLGLTDVLVVVLVADAASAGLTGDTDSIAEGFILVVTILFWSVMVDAVAYRWPTLAKILKARPRLLIEDGKLNHRVMKREFMSAAEVESHLRLHGVESLSQVHHAYLEPNGLISIIRRDDGETDEPEKPAF